MAKLGHSESIWITLVGKYWKSCKTACSLGQYDWCTWHRFLVPKPGNEFMTGQLLFTMLTKTTMLTTTTPTMPTTTIMDRRVTGNSTVYSCAKNGRFRQRPNACGHHNCNLSHEYSVPVFV